MNKDEDLLKRCQKGDSIAQEALFHKFASKMRYVCLRYARTSFEVDDIFQEAFVKVFSNIQQYSGNGSLEGWVRRVFVNTAIDYYKKNLRWNEHRALQPYEEGELFVNEDGFEELSHLLTENDLLELVALLPDGYRMVFNLHVIESFTHSEIASKLKISEGTSKSQLAKARKMLQNLVKQKLLKMQSQPVELNIEKGVSNIEVSA